MTATHAPAETPDAVALLCDRAAYADQPRSVQLLETHISWLFVTDHFVYKLKKPVRFDFVDFSTPESRHHACQEEIRLNCRLSPDVYLGTLPITRRGDGELELAGRGEPVDWVVQMRRLSASDALDRRLGEDRVSPDDETAIAELLNEFYSRQPPAAIDGAQYRADFERHIRAAAAVCLKHSSRYDQERVRTIKGQQLRYVHAAAALLDRRVTEGHVVDGHGDLRPEHIYLESPPAVIDCIEFSPELRRVDVLDDLSFLAMECDRLGQSQVGARIIAACQAARGEPMQSQLFDFYKSYRALVRAKVMMLRAEQTGDVDQRRFTRLAHQYVDWSAYYAGRLGPPAVIVVGGLMGTGKSTLATRIARAIGAELDSTDRIRRSLLGASESRADYGRGNYLPSHRARVYQELLTRAARALDRGRSVVLDGTFLADYRRTNVAALAEQHGGTPVYVECRCPRDVALARLAARSAAGGSDSEGRVELFDHQAAEQEPVTGNVAAVVVDTTLPIREQLQQVFCGLGHETEPSA
jgi:aminoglycoside phosphotransferase family enzyme/predicted kinase